MIWLAPDKLPGNQVKSEFGIEVLEELETSGQNQDKVYNVISLYLRISHN